MIFFLKTKCPKLTATGRYFSRTNQTRRRYEGFVYFMEQEKIKRYCHNMLNYRKIHNRYSVKDELFKDYLKLCEESERQKQESNKKHPA